MTELAFNIAGWGFTVVLAVGSIGLLLLHKWMRTLERNELENEDD